MNDTNTNIARLIELNAALAGSERAAFLIASDAQRVGLADAVEYILEGADEHAEKRLGAIASLASQGGIVLPAMPLDCSLGEYDDRREPGMRRYLSLVSELASGAENVNFEHETRCDLCAGHARLEVPAAYNEGARRALRELTGGLIAVGGGLYSGTHATIPLDASKASLALCDAVGELAFLCSDGGALCFLAEHDATQAWEHEQCDEFMLRAVEEVWGSIEPCLSVCEYRARTGFDAFIPEHVLGAHVTPDETVVVVLDHPGAIESLEEALRSLGETPDNIREASEGAARVLRSWFN